MKRVARTVLMAAFKELLAVKSLDKITVKEICEQCNLHRQTFYNHFDNILDLFKTLFYEDLARAVGPNKTLGTWQKGFLATLNYLRNNAAMIINVLHSSYWPEIRAYCGTLSSRLLDRVIGECMEDLGVQLEENDRRFIVNFYRRRLQIGKSA